MSTLFYLMRHGETYWNEMRRMQGQVNIPLNERGKAQAREAAERLKGVPFDICYSSPLSRAYDTAREVLKGRAVPIIEEPLLIEQGYGLSEGASQIGFHDPTSPLYGYEDKPEIYKPDIGAESFEELMERGNQIIRKHMLPAEKKYKRVLMVAHGAILCSITGIIKEIPLSCFWESILPNCAVRIFRLENGQFEEVEFGG